MTTLHFHVEDADGPKRFFNRLTRENIGHAYLFSGPPGIGKKTFARALGQSLLCEAPHPDGLLGYCGVCASCNLIGKEDTRHPDLLEHTGILKIGSTDDDLGFHESESITSRDLVRQLSLQSYSGGLRIFILGDVDFAGPPAANALLKFFEEPPAGVVMLLTTAMPSRLLPTIRSRLVDVRFSALSSALIERMLVARGIDLQQAKLGATLGQGSFTRALEAIQEDEEHLRAQVARWFFTVARGGTPEGTWATRDTLDEGLEVVKTLLRDWLALSHGGESPPLLAPDYTDRILQLGALPARNALGALAKVNEAQRLARTNVSPALVGDFVRMAITNTV